MMFWCWSQCGKCSHFVTAASRHYPHHHQGPYHLLTGDWGIVRAAPAPAPLQTAAQGGWPVWPGRGATHGSTTEKIQLFTVSSNSRVQQLWYRCALINTILGEGSLLMSPHWKCIKHFHTLVFKKHGHGHSNPPESGMLSAKIITGGQVYGSLLFQIFISNIDIHRQTIGVKIEEDWAIHLPGWRVMILVMGWVWHSHSLITVNNIERLTRGGQWAQWGLAPCCQLI